MRKMLENYEELWKALANLAGILQGKGEKIPKKIMKDLKSAKTLISVFRADPSRIQIVSKIETYLENVEAHLFYVAENKIGKQFAELWLKDLNETRKMAFEPKPITTSKFVPGLPRGEHWVRVQITDDIKKDSVERIAKNLKLSFKMQEDGYLLVYGKREKIRALIKKIAEGIKRKS